MKPNETKTIKRKKLSFKKILILFAILFTIGYSINYLTKLSIKTIKINGTSLIKDYEIIEIAGLKNYPSIFKVNTKKTVDKINQLPLVNEVSIKKDLFGKLTINIKENKVLFFNRSTNTLVLGDKSEIDFTEEYLGIPILINYVPDKIYELFVKSLQEVDSAILGLISEIEYSRLKSGDVVIDDTRFICRMNDGNTVYINIANLKELNDYVELYSQFDGKKGILNLDSTSDVFIFTPYDQMLIDEESE